MRSPRKIDSVLRAAALKSILIGTNSLTLWLNYCSALAIWFPVGEQQRLRCARRGGALLRKLTFSRRLSPFVYNVPPFGDG